MTNNIDETIRATPNAPVAENHLDSPGAADELPEPSPSRSLHVAVSEALAATEGICTAELEWSLHEYINPDAIDALETGSHQNWQLRFQVAEHTVIVDSDGTITVDGTEYPWCRS